MIRHRIIVEPEAPPPPPMQVLGPPINHNNWPYPSVPRKHPPLTGQDELDQLLARAPYGVGAWLTYNHLVHAPSQTNIQLVVGRVKNIADVRYEYNGKPKVLALSNFPVIDIAVYRRWDDIGTYRVLRPEEFKTLVQDRYDFLQNRIKAEQELFLAQPELWKNI